MSNDALNLDYLLEPVVPAGKVTLEGVEYELFQADVLENFLALTAMTKKAADSAKIDPECIPEEMERLRQELRNMIRVLVPEIPEEVLREKFPKIGQLQAAFSAILTKAYNQLPETVKKNSELAGTKNLATHLETEKISS